MKKIFTCLLFALAIAACKKQNADIADTQPEVVIKTDPGIKFYLQLTDSLGELDTTKIALTMAGDSVIGVVPGLSNQKSFAISFEPATANLKVGNVVQKSGVTINDFSKPVTYTYTNVNGVVKDLKVSIRNFDGIPIFYLNTVALVVSEVDYVAGSLTINTNGQFDPVTSALPLNIRGRGNSTWGMPKKPYRIKFNAKQSILGLQSAKNWVLLANYSDKTLLRNAVAFDMGHYFSADFTPHYRLVDVVMNGAYIGNYMLTEQVEVNPGRVDINELTPGDTDDDKITGGYLLEVDQRLDADKYFYSGRGLWFNVKEPDDITDKQYAYIQDYISKTEDAIFSGTGLDDPNGYSKYINVDSFINWYLVKELVEDNDAVDYSSIFYYKDTNGKLGMGPVWDNDIALGNYVGKDSNNPTGWWLRNAVWFRQLFQDPAFAARVKQRWTELQPTLPLILANIDKNAAYINLSQQQNFTTWDILNIYVWPNSQIAGSYAGEVSYLKTWLQTRIDWMNDNM